MFIDANNPRHQIKAIIIDLDTMRPLQSVFRANDDNGRYYYYDYYNDIRGTGHKDIEGREIYEPSIKVRFNRNIKILTDAALTRYFLDYPQYKNYKTWQQP